MTNEASENWAQTGKGAAAEIKIPPKELTYIEARGFLCHELLYLLGGHIQFVETSWRECVLKILELIFPISPICRWYPSEDCVLEWVGYHSQCETRAYRLTPKEGSITVFFVEYKPQPPAWGGYIRSCFNVPQLDTSRFLRPPFGKSNDNTKIDELLRAGLVDKFGPLPMTSGARNRISEIHTETCKGLWEEFSE